MMFPGLSFSTGINPIKDLFLTSGRLRIGGTTGPYHSIHLSDGNFYMEGGGEVGLLVKRFASNAGSSGPLGTRTNPLFTMMRISQAGDGDFEFKILFSADEETERVVYKFDSKGIWATIGVQGLLGRQAEGYLYDGNEHPWYTVNSEGGNHRYELGPGIDSEPDVAFTRTGTQSCSLQVGPTSQTLQSKLTVYGDAVVIQNGVSLVMPELTSTPGTPGAGSAKLYFKTDGQLYRLNSNGVETLIG